MPRELLHSTIEDQQEIKKKINLGKWLQPTFFTSNRFLPSEPLSAPGPDLAVFADPEGLDLEGVDEAPAASGISTSAMASESNSPVSREKPKQAYF